MSGCGTFLKTNFYPEKNEAEMATEVVERLAEQVMTTAETLRRHGVAYYDIVAKLGSKLGVTTERVRGFRRADFAGRARLREERRRDR